MKRRNLLRSLFALPALAILPVHAKEDIDSKIKDCYESLEREGHNKKAAYHILLKTVLKQSY